MKKFFRGSKNNKVLAFKTPLGLKELSDLIVVLTSLIIQSLHIPSKFEGDMIVIRFLVPNTNSSDKLATIDFLREHALSHCYN